MTRSSVALRAIEALQARVTRDEGKRGIAPLVHPGQLLAAAEVMVRAPASTSRRGFLVLTGFPCLRERKPPIESDGPPGAVALATTLLALGRSPVTLLIEDHSEHALQSCLQAAGCPAQLAVFPTDDRWTEAEDARLGALRAGACGLLSIERAGNSVDGVCYTMRGFPMGETLLSRRINSVASADVPTVGIGDGGNELGMGSLIADIAKHVNLGEKIGCVVAADAPVVASVSNWGGYALCCAVAMLTWDDARGASSQQLPTEADEDAALTHLDEFVPDMETARRTLLACSAAGAVDGITAEDGGSVDGMPLEAQLVVLEELRAIAVAAMRTPPV